MLYYKKDSNDTSFTIAVSELYTYYSGSTTYYTGMTMQLTNDANGGVTTLPIVVSDYNERYIITSLDLENYQEGNYTVRIYFNSYLLKIDRLLIYTTLDVYKD